MTARVFPTPEDVGLRRRPLVPEDTFTDTERALDAFARLAGAMAHNDPAAPRIAVLLVFGGGAPTGRRRRRARTGKRGSRETPAAAPPRASE